jgi:thiamine transport system permease protein
VVAAALLVFLFDFTSFGVVLVLGGPRFATLEVEIYNLTVNLFNLPLAATLCVLQLVFTLGLTVAYTRLSERLSRPLSLRPQRYTQRRLVSLRARLLASAWIALIVILLVAPLAALAVRSVTRLDPERGQRAPASPELTLAYYRELSINRRASLFFVPPLTAVGISLGYATATVALALALGLPASWALARDSHKPAQRLLDPILMLPLTLGRHAGAGGLSSLWTPSARSAPRRS